MKADILDILRRQNNMIIENAPEQDDSKELVLELASFLDIEDITRESFSFVSKWKAKRSNKSMVCVAFKVGDDKKKFLKKENYEKIGNIQSGVKFHGCKLYHDRSPIERTQHKEQIAEAQMLNSSLPPTDPYHFVVRLGRVVKVPKRPQQTS